MKKYFIAIILILTLLSCHIERSQDKQVDELLQTFKGLKGKAILFGHQDDLAYGINWKYIDGESDVKRVAGDYPAIYGWELGGLEQGRLVNLDSVPFKKMRQLAIDVYRKGGINTFSWHPFSVIDGVDSWTTDTEVVKHILPGGDYHRLFLSQLDKVGDFLKSLVTEEGQMVPFVFRPWHEMDGTWFWWGSTSCSPNELKELFRFTVNYLRDTKGVSRMLVAYSPDCNFTTKDEYLRWYPGDEYVDIIGMDNYQDLKSEGDVQDAVDKLRLVVDVANAKEKVSALTESGIENVTDSTWYTTKLGAVLNDSVVAANISYAMVWRNDPDVHFFFPYPGHSGAKYAKELLMQDNIWLLKDLNNFIKQQH